MDEFDGSGAASAGSLYYRVDERLVRVGEIMPFGEIRQPDDGGVVPTAAYQAFRMTMQFKLPWWQMRQYAVRRLRSGGKSHRGKETEWREG